MHVLHVCAYMCIHVATFVSFEINPYVHVLHVCAYMCIHRYTCVYMYTYVGHIQTTYTLLCVGAHNRLATPPVEAATGGPHSGQPWAAAPPLYPAIRDPFPHPFWRSRARCTRRGGQSRPPAQPRGPPITVGTQ